MISNVIIFWLQKMLGVEVCEKASNYNQDQAWNNCPLHLQKQMFSQTKLWKCHVGANDYYIFNFG